MYMYLFILTQFGFIFTERNVKIPSNFYGSSEVFSGYLSEQQQYIEAFSLHPDHVLISGSIENVEYLLETIQPEVKFEY